MANPRSPNIRNSKMVPASPGTEDSGGPSAPDVTVYVLLYGDYPELARRCLSSIRALAIDGSVGLRIGCNAISGDTEAVIRVLGMEPFVTVRSATNLKKYPMMKKLFQQTGAGQENFDIPTPFTMWFDDDSWLTAPDPQLWLAGVFQTMEAADLIGSVYTMALKGNQHAWIEGQPWYAGLPVPPGHRVAFCTGGWWTIRTEVLSRFHWPVPELLHRGGDVMLGELCRQQGLRVLPFHEGVAINADAEGRESKAPRRGFDSPPIGF